MIRITLIAAACLIALLQTPVQQQGVESLLTAETQATGKSSQTPDPPVEDERIQAEVAEIMAIRKQLGGGVAAALGDLSLEMPGKVQQPADGTGPENTPFDLEQEFANQIAAQSRENRALPTVPQPLTSANVSMTPPSERQEAVRHAARILEEAAAILEEATEYDHADQVRKTASDLWRAARKP